MLKKKKLNGSMTVEMSFLMPMVLLLVMQCILAAFYFHDKNIISGAAYETAVVGSTKAREKDGARVGELETLFQERIEGKCILFSGADVSVGVSEEEITVTVHAARKGFRLSIVKKASLTDPEKQIRDIRRIKKQTYGAKNND